MVWGGWCVFLVFDERFLRCLRLFLKIPPVFCFFLNVSSDVSRPFAKE